MSTQSTGQALSLNEQEPINSIPFYDIVEDFYQAGSASQFMETNNLLLDRYIRQAMEDKEDVKSLQTVIFHISYQNYLIVRLQEELENYYESVREGIEHVA